VQQKWQEENAKFVSNGKKHSSTFGKMFYLILFYFHRAFSSIDSVFHQLNALVIKTLKYSKTV
jgi:hypothetical protein